MPQPGLIERIAEKLKIIPDLHKADEQLLPSLTQPGKLTDYPPPEQWVEYEAKSWPWSRNRKRFKAKLPLGLQRLQGTGMLPLAGALALVGNAFSFGWFARGESFFTRI
jgi:hypothetical protein